MGSFNETCALSGINIPVGTPVRVLFLTGNPYENNRGCYHYDHWFARTPPYKATYADYGRAEYDDSPLTELIAKGFDRDVVEKPFGFNQYHDPPVFKGRGLPAYLEAAWEGRLSVIDGGSDGEEKSPEDWPTWRRVFDLFRKAKLPLQHEKKDGKGFNAQAVRPGIVCVDFNSYDDTTKKLDKALKVLSPHYDCRVVKKFEDRDSDKCLIVTVKGAFDNPSMLVNTKEVEWALKTHPEHYGRDRRELPVLAVMIREDVWQAYCNVYSKPTWYDERHGGFTVDNILQRLTEKYEENEGVAEKIKELEAAMKASPNDPNQEIYKQYAKLAFRTDEMKYRDLLTTLPFQSVAASHLPLAQEDPAFAGKDELLRACAELARVEYIMARLHHCWYIPPLGGQESEWELRTQLLTDIASVSKKAWDEYKAEYGDDDEEEVDEEVESE